METKLGRKCTQSVRRETNIIIYFVTRCELALGVCASVYATVCVQSATPTFQCGTI